MLEIEKGMNPQETIKFLRNNSEVAFNEEGFSDGEKRSLDYGILRSKMYRRIGYAKKNGKITVVEYR